MNDTPPDDAQRFADLEAAARLILRDPIASRVITYKGREELRGLIAYTAAARHRIKAEGST